METFANLIDGEWTVSANASENRNPSDQTDLIGLFAQVNTDQVGQAIGAARRALSTWSLSSPQLRHDILLAASNEVMARKAELARVLAREEGKALKDALGEVVRAAHVLSYFAGEALRLNGDVLASTRAGVEAFATREPVGVVGIVTPWNFPIAIPAWKIAPALAFGNTIVFKPAAPAPHSAWMLVDILQRAGLPAGVLNLVMGSGAMVGGALVASPEVDAISFTGSVGVGRQIAAGCIGASPMKKFQLEMGGKNPLVILDDADLPAAIECAANSAFYSTGQRCTAASRLIVTDGVHDRFVDGLRTRMAELQVGHALESETDIGPVVDEAQLESNLGYLDAARKDGARVVGGERLNRPTEGFFMAPALFLEADNAMRVCREEIFGPAAAVIRVKDYEEALAVANDTEFGLSSGICTTSLKYARDFRRKSAAGMVMVNLPTAGVDHHLPFGGRKGSSYGPREQGSYAREFYTSVKTAYVGDAQ